MSLSPYSFGTDRPVHLQARLGRGSLTVTAADTASTEVRVVGRHAQEVVVEHHDDTVSVVVPQHRGFAERDIAVDVTVVLPTGSDLDLRTGTADLSARGRYGAALLRSGSGTVEVEELTGPAQVETGSGDVHLATVAADVQVKSGSGDVRVDLAQASVSVSTGSGDVLAGFVAGDLAVKTGSGDLHVARPLGDVVMTTGSGDVVVEQAAPTTITVRGASTDARVGIPVDLPAWTDVTSLTGGVHATASRRGQPADGQPHLTLRVATVSGDIHLADA